MWHIEPNFKIKLGGNFYINTPDLIVYKGISLFTVKRSDDGLLGIDFDVYDKGGNKIATVRRGVIVQGNREEYDILEGQNHYSITEKSTGRIICDIRKRSESPEAELEVSVKLYLPNGFLIDVTSVATNIGGNIFSGCTFANCKAAIGID